MLPAGPDPTMSTSKRLSIIALSACGLELYGQARGGLVQRTATDPNRFAQDLFRPLPRRYDVLEELLSLGQNRRWRREMVAHVDNGDPTADSRRCHRDCRRRPRAHPPYRAHRSRVSTSPRRCCESGHGRVARVGAADRVRLLVGQAERLPFPDRLIRRADVHLSPALRRRSRRDAPRTRTRAQAGRGDRKPGVLGSSEPVLAVLVVAVHPRRVAGCRLCHRRS